MKKILLPLLLAFAAVAYGQPQNQTVYKDQGNNLTGNLIVPSGRSLTIAAGATIIAQAGSTVTGFGSGGGGTVNSVAITMPAPFVVAGSPVTTSGTLAITYGSGTIPSAVGGAGSITGIVKASAGVTSAATPGTDYENPLTFSSGLNRSSNTITIPAGGVTNSMLAGSIDLTSKVINVLPLANGGFTITSAVLGDTWYASGANTITALPGNTTTTKKFKIQTGNGSVSAAPVWGTIVAADLPLISLNSGVTGNLSVGNLNGGSGASPTTFWRGDNTWATPSGSGNVTAGTLTANQIVLGNGGTAIVTLGSLGTTTTLLHGNAAGAPTFGAVNLASDITGNIPIANIASGSGASSSTFLRGDNTWATPPGTGTVTTLSVASANGFAGSVATATTTPVITISTSITGIIKGAGSALTAATAGTDYEVPLSFSTGLTRASNTVSVNSSQSINTLSNLTSNGLVTTSGGTGSLSVSAMGTGSLAALAVNSGTAGSFIVNGAAGTLAGGTLSGETSIPGHITYTSVDTITITSNAGTIDATKGYGTATNGAATTLTMSSDTTTVNTFLSRSLVNSSGSNAMVFTLKNAAATTIATVTVPASTTVPVSLRATGTAWVLYGGALGILDLATNSTPAAAQVMESVNATTGTPTQSTITQLAATFDAVTTTLTNKTYDTVGTGNVFKINGAQVSSIGTGLSITSGVLSSSAGGISSVSAGQGFGTTSTTSGAVTVNFPVFGEQIVRSSVAPESGTTWSNIGGQSVSTQDTSTPAFTAGTTTSPPGITYTSAAATSGRVAGIAQAGSANLYANNPVFIARAKVDSFATGNIRTWIGTSDNDPSGSDAPGATNIAAFRYSTGIPDTNFQCIVNDGAGSPTATDSGVAADANIHLFKIAFTSGHAKFYIDGALVADVTSNLPTGSATMGWYVETTTLNAATKNQTIYQVTQITP